MPDGQVRHDGEELVVAFDRMETAQEKDEGTVAPGRLAHATPGTGPVDGGRLDPGRNHVDAARPQTGDARPADADDVSAPRRNEIGQPTVPAEVVFDPDDRRHARARGGQ